MVPAFMAAGKILKILTECTSGTQDCKCKANVLNFLFVLPSLFKKKKKKKVSKGKREEDCRFFGCFQSEAVTTLWSSCPDWWSLAHPERTCCGVSMSSSKRARWRAVAAAGFWMKPSAFWVLWFVQNSCKEAEKHWERPCGFLPEHS